MLEQQDVSISYRCELRTIQLSEKLNKISAGVAEAFRHFICVNVTSYYHLLPLLTSNLKIRSYHSMRWRGPASRDQSSVIPGRGNVLNAMNSGPETLMQI